MFEPAGPSAPGSSVYGTPLVGGPRGLRARRLFDGAWLVQNFERLNPANTYWKKQYHLYANVDTETKRYLEFERWWGGHVVLGGDEIQYIVDNLFVGNRLSTAQLVTRDGRRIDLRNELVPQFFCAVNEPARLQQNATIALLLRSPPPL